MLSSVFAYVQKREENESGEDVGKRYAFNLM